MFDHCRSGQEFCVVSLGSASSLGPLVPPYSPPPCDLQEGTSDIQLWSQGSIAIARPWWKGDPYLTNGWKTVRLHEYEDLSSICLDASPFESWPAYWRDGFAPTEWRQATTLMSSATVVIPLVVREVTWRSIRGRQVFSFCSRARWQSPCPDQGWTWYPMPHANKNHTETPRISSFHRCQWIRKIILNQIYYQINKADRSKCEQYLRKLGWGNTFFPVGPQSSKITFNG